MENNLNLHQKWPHDGPDEVHGLIETDEVLGGDFVHLAEVVCPRNGEIVLGVHSVRSACLRSSISNFAHRHTLWGIHSVDIFYFVVKFWHVLPAEWLILQLLDRKCDRKLKIHFGPKTYTVGHPLSRDILLWISDMFSPGRLADTAAIGQDMWQ